MSAKYLLDILYAVKEKKKSLLGVDTTVYMSPYNADIL